MKWIVFNRGAVEMHRLACLIEGIQKFGAELNDCNFNTVISATQGDKFWWAHRMDEIEELAKKILEKTKTKEGKEKHIDKIKAYANRAIKSSEKVRWLNLKELTDDEITEMYKEHSKESIFALAIMNTDIDALDQLAINLLKKKIKDELSDINEEEFLKIFNALSMLAHNSYLSDEESEILRLVVKGNKDASKVLNKYWWTSLGWECMKRKHEEDFLKAIEEWKLKDAKKKLEKNEARVEKIKKERKEIIKKYNLSKETENLIELLDDYAHLHDLRKEMQMKTTYSFYLLLKEVAKRTGCKLEELEWMWGEEIFDLLKTGKYDEEEIRKRKDAVTVVADDEGIKTYSGEEAAIVRKELLEEEVGDVKEIKGVGASVGFVVGKVKVCDSSKEAARKIAEGDILVCGMTLPEYLPSMKKAKAIVTDEGGITCHAAIVSRELGIPCVIGTKIATRVLKDGDEVEVNANDGTVKVLR